MNFWCFILCVFVLIQPNRGNLIKDTNGNCVIDKITNDTWEGQLSLDTINDTQTGPVFKSTYSNIKKADQCGKYFCFQLIKNEFQIIPNSKTFPGIDGDPKYERIQKADIVHDVAMTCEDDQIRNLTFKITVLDTNNHDPEFSAASYNYTLPMPMPPNVDIMSFGNSITVQDKDFSNTQVKFSIDSEEFSYEVTNGEKGTFSYVLKYLKFNAIEKWTATKTFQLTAEDSGTPPRSSTVPVTINIDEKISQPPAFTKYSYLYEYDSATTTIKAINEPAELLNIWDEMTCTVQDPYQEYIGVNRDDKVLKLEVKKPLDDKVGKDGIARITLQCYLNKAVGVSEADIIIRLPKNTGDTVAFKSKKYTAQYINDAKNPTIEMKDPILLNGPSDGYKISIDDSALAEYLNINVVDGGWTVQLWKPLSDEDLKKTEISFVIKLSKEDSDEIVDDAFVILLLPNGLDGVHFTESFFNGDYTFDKTGDGSMDPITIQVNNNHYDVVGCGLENSDYSQFFDVSCGKNSEPKLSLKSKIGKDLLKETVIPLSFYMKIKLGDMNRTIKTVILLNLKEGGGEPTTTTEKPDSGKAFKSKKYTAQYINDAKNPTIEMKDPISLNGPSDGYKISIDDSALAEYLNINVVDGGWTVHLSKPLSDEDLKKTEISFVINLSKKDSDEIVDDAFVTLFLPNGLDGVHFTESFFNGDYNFDKAGDGSMDPITIQVNNNHYDVVGCGLENSDYSQFFDVSCGKNSEPKLSLKSKIGKDLLKETVIPLSFYMKIKLGDMNRTIKTVILLNLKEGGGEPTTTTEKPDSGKAFKSKKYTAQYINDAKNPTIEMKDPISLNGPSDGYKISIDDSALAEYLNINVVDGGWTVHLSKPLSDEDLKKTEISFVIKLSKKDSDEIVDDAFVTLFLPNGLDGVYFTESFFKGDYTFDKTGDGSMDPITIQVNNNHYDVTECGLDSSDYSQFFDVSCGKNSDPKLSLKSKIGKELLKETVIPLSFHMKIKLGEIKRMIKTVILLSLLEEGGEPTSTTEKPGSEKEDCSHLGWIITTIVIFVLLVIYIILTVTYYFKRIRNRAEEEFEETNRRSPPHFEPHVEKRTSEKFKNVATRRPTGFIRYNPDLDRDSLNSDNADAQEEVDNNTKANRFLSSPEEIDTDKPEVVDSEKKNIGFEL